MLLNSKLNKETEKAIPRIDSTLKQRPRGKRDGGEDNTYCEYN